MAADPSIALQAAIYAALSAANVAPAIVHTVKDDTPLPWVVLGEDQIFSDYDSADFNECHATVHVFASTIPECKSIGGKVRETLDTKLNVTGFDCTEYWFSSSRYFRDPDGQTAHGVLEFQYSLIARPI